MRARCGGGAGVHARDRIEEPVVEQSGLHAALRASCDTLPRAVAAEALPHPSGLGASADPPLSTSVAMESAVSAAESSAVSTTGPVSLPVSVGLDVDVIGRAIAPLAPPDGHAAGRGVELGLGGGRPVARITVRHPHRAVDLDPRPVLPRRKLPRHQRGEPGRDVPDQRVPVDVPTRHGQDEHAPHEHFARAMRPSTMFPALSANGVGRSFTRAGAPAVLGEMVSEYQRW